MLFKSRYALLFVGHFVAMICYESLRGRRALNCGPLASGMRGNQRNSSLDISVIHHKQHYLRSLHPNTYLFLKYVK